mgnify:FL=1
MEIIDAMNKSKNNYATAVALGNFDGIHVGHQYLLNDNIEKAKEKSLIPSVLIFRNHTKTILKDKKSSEIDILTTYEQKMKILEGLGIEVVYAMDFNEDIMRLSPDMFINDIVLGRLNARLITVGFDYRFGYKAQGNSEYLKKYGKRNGFEVNIIDPVYIENEIVSSTSIRNLIRSGNIKKANRFLGRNFSLIGTVIRGRSRGRKLGFPTANIRLADRYVIPKTGVYKTFTTLGSSRFVSLTNIGYNPTFNEKELKIETYMLGFSGDIYGQTIEVEFIEFIRDDIKFNTVEELKEQMYKDLRYIKNSL